MSFKPEVIADTSIKWCGNALRFATREEAEGQSTVTVIGDSLFGGGRPRPAAGLRPSARSPRRWRGR